MDKKDSDFDEILDDLFRTGAENLRRMREEKVQNGCNDDTSKDTNHESGKLLNFPIFPATNEFYSICEHDVDLEKEEDQVEDDDDGDTYDIWDITVEDVERIRKFLSPNISDEMDEVIQPLIPQSIHTTPPNDDYVAPATKSILDELLEEFRDEILNVTMVDEEADFNPTKDIEELERILAKDPQSYFTEIQVHSVITKPKPFIHTQPMSPYTKYLNHISYQPNRIRKIEKRNLLPGRNSKEMRFEVTSNHNYVVKVLLSKTITA
nr:hypothetical protein [Tanacetum cinerariifolium]